MTLPAAYVHPTFDGDDIDIDTGALTGATVISDLDFNITTNAEGHVTDANATIATRTLTLADLGYTGDADANNKVYDISAVTTTGGALLRLNDSDSVTDDVKFASGTQVNVVYTDANTITINHADVTRSADGTSEDSPGFAGTFTVVDSVTSDARGHVTAVNVKTVTLPTETTLTDVDTQTGTWLTDITVNDHEITLSRSNTTTATITVGELIITKAEDPAQTGNLTVGGNAVIAGNLTVSGTVTTINTETIALADNIIELNSNIGEVEPTQNAGIEINRGTETNYQFLFDETTDEFKIGEIGGLQPVLTRDEVANLEESDILVWNSTAGKAVGKTFDELALPNKYAVTIGDGTATTYTITHNLNTTDITYSVKEVSNGEIVFTNVTVTGVNTISVSFAVAPTTNQYRVVVIG